MFVVGDCGHFYQDAGADTGFQKGGSGYRSGLICRAPPNFTAVLPPALIQDRRLFETRHLLFLLSHRRKAYKL